MQYRSKAGFALLLVLAASLACGPVTLPGTQIASPGSTPTSSSVPTPSPSPASEGTPPEVLLPGDYLEAVEERAAAGAWTYEEGLLAVLRTFAGQADDPFGPEDLADREGTGVVLEALAYVRRAPEGPIRSEMESLLSVVLPTSDRLKPYAQPGSLTRRRPPGLAAPAPDALCADLYAAGFPEGSNAICYIFAQEPLGEYSLEVFWPSEWASGSAEYLYAQAAVQAVKDSWSVFHDGLGMKAGGVQVVFTLLPHQDKKGGPNILASVPSKGGSVGCIMPVYPYALQFDASETDTGLAQFKQVIAHEMFHCFQQWNYPDHFEEWAVQRWWGEGSAEYFSNLVYPNTNWEWRRRSSFASRSTTDQIFYMTYETTFFFQFLEKKIQPSGILDLFHLLPTGKPILEHQKTLSGYVGMADYWHEFAQAVVDDSLIDTGGAAIPFPDYLTDTATILKTDTHDLPARDFVLSRYRINLGSGLGYHVTVDQADAEILHAARPGEGGTWDPIAIDRETGCARYLAVVTSTGTQVTLRTFRVAGVVDQPAAPGSVCDTCVVGRWRMNHTSYLDMVNAVTSEAGDVAPYATGASGDLFLNVRDDGTVAAQAASFGVISRNSVPDAQGNPMEAETTMLLDGTTEMTYLAVDGEFVVHVVQAGIDAKFTVSIMGQELELPIDDLAKGFANWDPGDYVPYNYVCTPKKTLVLKPIIQAGLYKGYAWDFEWVGP